MKILNFMQFVNENITMQEAAGPEPVLTPADDSLTLRFLFDEGRTSLSVGTQSREDILASIKKWMTDKIKLSIPTIKEFIDKPATPLPAFIQFYVGTSVTGSSDANAKVAKGRMDFLNNLYLEVMNDLKIRPEVAYQLLVNAPKNYTPTRTDIKFYDATMLPSNALERIGEIIINPITTMGLNSNEIGKIEYKLISASTWFSSFIDGDEDLIDKVINQLQTYTDIIDLNNSLKNANQGTLEEFLNKQLGSEDYSQRTSIINAINRASNRSNKGNIAKSVGEKISILLT